MGSLIVGLLIGGVLVGLALWTNNKNIAVKWYEWLIIVVGAALLIFTIQNFNASFAGYESNAAWLYALVMGVPALILLVVAWVLIQRRQRAAG